MIREGRIEDIKVLTEYNYLLALETEELILDKERLAKGVEACIIDSSKGTYYVYEEDNMVVGQLMITKEWSDWRNGEFWWIMSVYVHKDYRKKGIFKKLYNHVQGLAQQKDEVVGLRLYVEFENEKAQKTYEKLGMEKTNYFIFEEEF